MPDSRQTPAAARGRTHNSAPVISRTGAREAEGSGLLSRSAGDRRVGSNPTPSASEPDRFSGASGQREVGPAGNEGRRSGSDQAAATVQDRKLKVQLARIEERHGHAIGFEYHQGGLRPVCRCGWVGTTQHLSPMGACWVERELLCEAYAHAGTTDPVLWTVEAT